MANKNDVVVGLAAILYSNRATEDAIREEPDFTEIANEAWALYFKLEDAVRRTENEASRGASP
jgi:hypothetical protein